MKIFDRKNALAYHSKAQKKFCLIERGEIKSFWDVIKQTNVIIKKDRDVWED